MRTLATLLVPLIVTGVMVFSIVDLVTIDDSRVKHLPKFAWIILVILLPLIGAIIWFLVGRERAERSDGSSGVPFGRRAAKPAPPRALGPDDDPRFLESLGRDQHRDDRIAELEARLRELDDDQGTAATPGADGGGQTGPAAASGSAAASSDAEPRDAEPRDRASRDADDDGGPSAAKPPAA
jgi:hypothetical protein